MQSETDEGVPGRIPVVYSYIAQPRIYTVRLLYGRLWQIHDLACVFTHPDIGDEIMIGLRPSILRPGRYGMRYYLVMLGRISLT